MFANTICRVMIALAYIAGYVFATGPMISVRLSGPEYVDSVQDLIVVVTITNVGEQIIGVLNDPQGPLSTMETDTFFISNVESGESPSFVGIQVKYAAEKAAAQGGYSVLAPGQTVTVKHDLSLAYDFIPCGGGDYMIDVKNHFYIINPSHPTDISSVYADTYPFYSHVSRRGRLLASNQQDFTEMSSPMNAWSTFEDCDASQVLAIKDAIPAAQQFAKDAYARVKASLGLTGRYEKWFGKFSTKRHRTVVSHFKEINNNKFSTFTYNCSCTEAGTYAYVLANKFGRIWLCPEFWKARLLGTNSKAGTLLHEASHFKKNGGTKDYKYGVTKCKKLAKDDPDKAIMNADNHQYFEENP